jgi:hypothetical protein
MKRHEITPTQLRGYKAALSRKNWGNGNYERPDESTLHKLTPEQTSEVRAYIRAGVPDSEIESVYNLTKMQLAAQKAAITREANKTNYSLEHKAEGTA